MKAYYRVTALLLSLVPIDRAFAGFFEITPTPTPPPVPEIDGSGGIAAVALLASVVAILISKSRNR